MTAWADSLWTEASLNHEGAAREAALDRVSAELEEVMPFFFASRSTQEYGHRRDLASDRLVSIAVQCGVEASVVYEHADRQMALYFDAIRHLALPEGDSSAGGGRGEAAGASRGVGLRP